jgi:hypothetical protein
MTDSNSGFGLFLSGALQQDIREGVVTLSQIERNSPITANAEVWGFNHLACCSIAEITLIGLNVTTPSRDRLSYLSTGLSH